MQYRWEGYSEALLLYALALGSPTFPLPDESWAAFTATYTWKRIYDYELLYSGPLFTHQLSQVWIDCRGIQDSFMKDHGLDILRTVVERPTCNRSTRSGIPRDSLGTASTHGA